MFLAFPTRLNLIEIYCQLCATSSCVFLIVLAANDHHMQQMTVDDVIAK
jgi:hypothetical protein